VGYKFVADITGLSLFV